LKDGYPKLILFKDGYPNCKSDERLRVVISEDLPNYFFKQHVLKQLNQINTNELGHYSPSMMYVDEEFYLKPKAKQYKESPGSSVY
jgi:hypothetical protein